jgi:hypothetical protein
LDDARLAYMIMVSHVLNQDKTSSGDVNITNDKQLVWIRHSIERNILLIMLFCVLW